MAIEDGCRFLTRDIPSYMLGVITVGDIGDAVIDLHYCRCEDSVSSKDSGADVHCPLTVAFCTTLMFDGAFNEKGSDPHEDAADVSSEVGTKLAAMSHYRDPL